VQANAAFHESIYYRTDDALVVAQYLPSTLTTEIGGAPVTLTQEDDPQTDSVIHISDMDTTVYDRPNSSAVRLSIKAQGQRFALRLRCPWWLRGDATLLIDGRPLDCEPADGYLSIEREWHDERLSLRLPKGLSAWPLSDRGDTVAFLDGPVALAGLCAEQRTLYGNVLRPETLLIPDNEREWASWTPYYRTINQPVNFRFAPLYEIGYEPYTVYFQIMDRPVFLANNS